MRLVALDLVRFFAAFAVVMYHYTARADSNSFETLSKITQFGYLGVPLFFIISGYVIALSANNRAAFEFAVSRFIRLYPAFWAGIFFTVAMTALYGEKSFELARVLANLTMLNEYMGFANLDRVYWTLQAELKFYGCVFLLLLLGVFDKFKVWMSVWLICTITFLLFEQPFFMGWFISPAYSCFFIAGVSFYLIQKQGENSFNLFMLFSSLIISSVYTLEYAPGYMSRATLADEYISVAIIWLMYVFFYILVKEKLKLANRSIYMTLGGLTYPLYLIHNVAGRAIIDHYKVYYSDVLVVSSVTSLIVLVSWLIHVGVEKRVATPIKLFLLNFLSRLPIAEKVKSG